MDIEQLKIKLSEVKDALKKELAGFRANRPTAALVEDIKVVCYDQSMTIKQIGSISIVPPREIQIQVWDKTVVNDVVKAIEANGAGLSPQSDGNLIRVYLPELSQERRQELAKKVGQVTEQFRIQVRHWRDEANKEAQAAFDRKEIGEDQKFRNKEMIQKEIDKANADIESILNIKIREIEE